MPAMSGLRNKRFSASPREFRFVTNCADENTEMDRLTIVMWPYTVTKEKADEALEKKFPAGSGQIVDYEWQDQPRK